MKRLIVLALILTGCAAEKPAADQGRYLSQQEDAQLRERCRPYEKSGGCAVIPAPLFEKLILSLNACRQEHSL